MSPAAAFCTTCSALVAPAITLPTIGFPASQASASCANLIPRASANACKRSTAPRFCGREPFMNGIRSNREPVGIGPPRYFPLSRPLARGYRAASASGDRAARNDRLLGVTHQDAVIGLHVLCRDHERDYLLFATCAAWTGA